MKVLEDKAGARMKKEAEYSLSRNSWQAILNSCFGNIFITDGTGKIIFINDSSAKSLGVSPEEMVGLSAFELKKNGIVSGLATETVLQSGRTAVRSINCLRTHLNLAVVCNPVYDDEGNVAFTITYSQTESEINEILASVVQERERVKKALSFVTTDYSIVAESPAFRNLLDECRRIAPTSSTIFLTGESGTGKDVLAKYIHSHSACSQEIFLPVNCGAIPAELIESEFFGYERGSFTGANREGKAGLFELADNGSIFLDEIGELPLSLQSRLLRVLDTGEILRIGGKRPRKVNVRFIAATNRDLGKMVRNGEFRADLFYRLNVIPFRIPPLRKRPEDIAPLVYFFLNYYNHKYKRNKYFSQQTMKALLAYSWPGNIRELKNMVERMVVISSNDEIHITTIAIGGSEEEAAPAGQSAAASSLIPTQGDLRLKNRVEQFEAEYIQAILRKNNFNMSRTAAQLGLHRSALYKKIVRLRIGIERHGD